MLPRIPYTLMNSFKSSSSTNVYYDPRSSKFFFASRSSFSVGGNTLVSIAKLKLGFSFYSSCGRTLDISCIASLAISLITPIILELIGVFSYFSAVSCEPKKHLTVLMISFAKS